MLQGEEKKQRTGYNPIHECHFWEERGLAASSVLRCGAGAVVGVCFRAASSREQGGTVCSPAELGTRRVAVVPSQGPVAARALRGGQAGRREQKTRRGLRDGSF